MFRRSRIFGVAVVAVLPLLFGCQTTEHPSTPFATFTPLGGFQLLGVDTPTAAVSAVPTSTPGAGSQTEASATPAPTETLLPSPSLSPTPTPPETITMIFTGQIVPARCVQAETDRRGEADFLYENVSEVLAGADLTVGTLNAAITGTPPMTGCVETFVLVGSPVQADAMAVAGFDLMSISTNHIKNCGLTSCGDNAFYDTLENLQRVGIQTVGAGRNQQEAEQPVVVEVKGVRFGFVSLGQIEPLAFAGEETPGIGVLNEENLQAGIAAARQSSDYVIVLPHWGPEYTHYPNNSQMSLARLAVEAGADLVVGNHTHYIQAFIEHHGVPVFFGLGNFIFDQTQEPQRQQSLIVRAVFEGAELASFEVIPAVYDRSGAARIASPEEAVEILTGIQAVNDDVQANFNN